MDYSIVIILLYSDSVRNTLRRKKSWSFSQCGVHSTNSIQSFPIAKIETTEGVGGSVLRRTIQAEHRLDLCALCTQDWEHTMRSLRRGSLHRGGWSGRGLFVVKGHPFSLGLGSNISFGKMGNHTEGNKLGKAGGKPL
jgi:hypothetical protein